MPKPGLSGAAGRISSSIIAERSHRFYARGFSGWKITGGQGHSCQRDHDCCERKRIGWSCTEKERAIARATTSDAMLPVAIPISVSRSVFPRTLNCTCATVAPSAIRMPISWVAG